MLDRFTVLALCNAVAGGWSSVALSEWSPYPGCFECECVRDKEKWSPWSSGRHIRVIAITGITVKAYTVFSRI